MKKNGSKRTKNQETNAPVQRPLRLAAIIRRNLYAFVIDEGMKALDELLERDRNLVCGPAHRKRGSHEAQRWGYTQGRLAMGGQRVTVRKPRARRDGEEVPLPSWEQFADQDPLDERTLQQMLVGVSTRDYGRSVEPIPEKHHPHGASRSAASRRFVAKTKDGAFADTWRGTAPFCNGKCLPGEKQVATSKTGNGALCWTGKKVLCHNSEPLCTGRQTRPKCYAFVLICEDGYYEGNGQWKTCSTYACGGCLFSLP